jgi:hypothetical protein
MVFLQGGSTDPIFVFFNALKTMMLNDIMKIAVPNIQNIPEDFYDVGQEEGDSSLRRTLAGSGLAPFGMTAGVL